MEERVEAKNEKMVDGDHVERVDVNLADPYRTMILEAVGASFNPNSNVEFDEPPNQDAKKFYDLLKATEKPLYEGCSRQTPLSAVSRLLNIKSEFNMKQLLCVFNSFMAHNQVLREASWSESQTTPAYSSSSSLGYSTEDSGDLEPDFIIPRQGPITSIINRVWKLQQPVQVVGRSRNVYVFEFGSNIDKEVIQNEGPWAIQNKFLVMKPWQPNLILEKFYLNAVPVWVEFWGFPLEYYTTSVTDLVGSMVGDVLQVDFFDKGIRN
ncbi:uncharacterized protein G2W53_040624 [Senna tora]|uniref:DUF4283 domain-containing protein n=1 Tax=Senna tora TaxID=362788 RepID=A0A834VXD2_9FABA|nr:uncharacterized protein G2W53_040624 [Senna tora]